MIGKNQSLSIYNTQNQYSFSKSSRFNVPTKKVAAPSPSNYTPQTNLNQNYNSTFIRNAQTVFGRNNYSIIDQHFKTKNTSSPGPGAYKSFSEFTGAN